MNRDENVRPESIQYFEEKVRSHSKVVSIQKREECIYLIERKGMSNYVLMIVNVYSIGEFEIERLWRNYKFDGVLTISQWNSYTQGAKQWGIDRGIGVFDSRDWFGALNYERPEHYVIPEENYGRPRF